MSEWYLKTTTEELGPFSAAEMRSKAETGELRVDSQVRRSSDHAWTAAGRIKGLFPTGNADDGAVVSSSTKPPAPPPKATFYSNRQNTFLLACVGLVFLLTLVNIILIFATRQDTETTTASVEQPHEIHPERAYENLAERLDSLVNRIERNEERVDHLADKIDTPRPERSEKDSVVDRFDLPRIEDTASAEAPRTPRDAFFAQVVERDWVESYYTELGVDGKTIRSNNLDVRVDKILRSDDRLDLFVTVKNAGTGQVFSPQTHPYNEQMIFPANSKFIDSFMNWSVIRLERGTQDLKPGESGTIQYSAEIKIDAPFYMWTLFLQTSNDDYSGFYIIASPDDFSKH